MGTSRSLEETTVAIISHAAAADVTCRRRLCVEIIEVDTAVISAAVTLAAEDFSRPNRATCRRRIILNGGNTHFRRSPRQPCLEDRKNKNVVNVASHATLT